MKTFTAAIEVDEDYLLELAKDNGITNIKEAIEHEFSIMHGVKLLAFKLDKENN